MQRDRLEVGTVDLNICVKLEKGTQVSPRSRRNLPKKWAERNDSQEILAQRSEKVIYRLSDSEARKWEFSIDA